jgi:DNA-3-methyladenine glycosylase II
MNMGSPISTRAALKHFTIHDPTLATLLRAGLSAPPKQRLELPTPQPPEAYFGSIVRSIVSQQISTKAAEAVFNRVVASVGATRAGRRHVSGLTPESILAVPEDTLRGCGLSRQKTSYLRRNAVIWNTLDVSTLAHHSDEAVITELTKLYGVGRWTAEMFLMFTLARPDVFSFGDLGLMQSIYQHYPHRPHHTRKIAALAQSWSPHRTLAALTLWWHKDGGPVVL